MTLAFKINVLTLPSNSLRNHTYVGGIRGLNRMYLDAPSIACSCGEAPSIIGILHIHLNQACLSAQRRPFSGYYVESQSCPIVCLKSSLIFHSTPLLLPGCLWLCVDDGLNQLAHDLVTGFLADLLYFLALGVCVLLCILLSFLVAGAVLHGH